MDIFDHPGNLGSTRGTLLTIHHADWPAYPEGEDFRTPLLQLTAFPPGTQFHVVDDIDRSLLLIADVQCWAPDKPLDPCNFHVSVWHEDLVEMCRRGYIAGVEGVRVSDWRSEKWAKLRSIVPEGAEIGYMDHVTNDFRAVKERSIESDEDEDALPDWIVSHGGRISVTESGREYLLQELRSQNVELATAVSAKVARLFELGFFDTCIREACVQLEHEIKLEIKSKQYGDRLTESVVKSLRDGPKYLESDIRTFRQELRALFKLVRNEYMHNLFEADMITAYAILFRVARIRAMLANSPKR